VPAAIAKGNKAREIRLPLRLLRRLHDYVDVERANVLARGQGKQHQLGREQEPILIAEYGRGSVVIGDRAEKTRVRLDLLTPSDRRRLIARDTGAPAALWLAENGRPMTPAAWEAVFRRASARCQGLGFDLDVTPHALRHTFAVHMLSMLIREQIGTVVHDRNASAGAAVYRRMIGDPLQKLQRLMGHASIISTHIYLDSLEESRVLVEAAAARWAADVEDRA
jgi:integrase